MKQFLPSRFRIKIDAIDDEGRGRGLYKQDRLLWDVAVRGAFPGDVVDVVPEKVFKTRQLVQCRTLHVVSQGDVMRLQERCSFHGECPTCPLKNIDEGFAFACKEQRVENALISHGLQSWMTYCEPVVSSRGTRVKIKWVTHITQHRVRFGLYIPHTHEFVPMAECPYIDERLYQAAKDVSIFLSEGLRLGMWSIHEVTPIKAMIARAGKEGVLGVLVSEKEFVPSLWEALRSHYPNQALCGIAERIDVTQSNSLIGGTIQRTSGLQKVTDEVENIMVEADAFVQADPWLASHMYQEVARTMTQFLGNQRASTRIWDVFAGQGGVSRAFLSQGYSQIVAVENSSSAVSTLKTLPIQTMPLNAYTQIDAIRETMKNPSDNNSDILVLDPPRKGLLHTAMEWAQMPMTICVLIACDPDVGAKDAKVFVEHGWKISKIEVYDFFPGTTEIETVFYMMKS